MFEGQGGNIVSDAMRENVIQKADELLSTGAMNDDTTQDLHRIRGEMTSGSGEADDLRYVRDLYARIFDGNYLEELETEKRRDQLEKLAAAARSLHSSRANSLSEPQRLIVGLAVIAESLVLRLSFGLFTPDWGQRIFVRLKRNNALVAERAKSRGAQ